MRVALFALALLAAVPARAAVIFSDSFEQPVAGFGNAVAGAPSGWEFVNQSGFVGVYNQGDNNRLAFVPDGDQFAYIGYGTSGGGRLVRNSERTIGAGNTYSFQAYVGADEASSNQNLWQIEMWSGRPLGAGSALLGLVNANSAGASIPEFQSWALNEVRYTAAASGGELWVALNLLAPATSGFNDAVYDLATLQVEQPDSQPVPAPGGIGLLAVGLAAACALRRRGLPSASAA